MRHHEQSIANYVARISALPETVAIVVTGSVARGTEKPGSDVDLYLVVTDVAWDAAWAANRLMFIDHEGIEYEGGYFDVKLATLAYISDAATFGDDPVRDSFAHSRVAFSRVADLDERLRAASEVSDEQWVARRRSFIAQCRLHGDYFLAQGTATSDPVLTWHAAVHLALAASRALLALNRVLYQGPKYVTKSVAALPHKPDGFGALVEELLARPTVTAGRAVLETVENFADWGLPDDETLSTFVLDNELAWRYRTTTPEYS